MLHLEQLEPRVLLSVLITDSVAPDDDQEITFGDTATGHISEQQSVSVHNESLTEPVTITELSLTGANSDSFSLGYAAEKEFPPGLDPLLAGQLYLNERIEGSVDDPAESGWHYIDLQKDHVFTIQTFTGSMWNIELNVWTENGDQLAQDDMYYRSAVHFATPYTGRYYVEVHGYDHTIAGTYEVYVTQPANEITEIELSEGPSNISGSLEQGYFINGFEWFRLNAEYGSQLQISCSLGEDPLPEETFLALALNVYDGTGTPLESLILTNIEDKNTAINATIDLTTYAKGDYYISITSLAADILPYPFELTVEQTGSILELAPDQTIEIPIWFTPQVGQELEGQLVIETDGGGKDEIALYGTALPGDLTVTDIQFPEAGYPNFVMSESPLIITTEITNLGPGVIFDYFDDDPDNRLLDGALSFYLSTGDVFDPDEVEIVRLEDIYGGVSFPVASPIPDENITNNTTTVLIPPVSEGDYYIFAVIDADERIDEILDDNNVLISSQIHIDSYSTLALDSVEDPLDQVMDFGQTAIGRNYPEHYASIFNRGSEEVTITDWQLADGCDFELLNWNLPNEPQDEIVLMPGETQNIWVRFAPRAFNSQSQPEITDTLIVSTNETQHSFDLSGTVTGADLIVLENSGTENDDILDIPAIRPDETSEAVTFTIVNNGDQVLRLNEAVLENGAESPFELILPENFGDPLIPDPNHENGVQIEVLFDPSVAGEYSETITIHSYSDLHDDYTYTLHVHAFAIEPILTINENIQLDGRDDHQLKFGWQPFDEASPTTIQLTNSADQSLAQAAGLPEDSVLTISGWEFTQNSNAFEIIQENDPDSPLDDIILAAGETVTLDVRFLAPSAEADTMPDFFSDTLSFSSNGGNQDILLTGHADQVRLEMTNSDGSANPNKDLALSNVNVDHNTTDAVVSDWFFLRSGSVETILNDITVVNDTAIFAEGFSITVIGTEIIAGDGPLDLSEMSMPAGESLRINVSFDAEGIEPGEYTGSVVINVNAPEAITIELGATVISPEIQLLDPANPDRDLSILPLEFQNSVNIGAEQSTDLLISNEQGASELIISDWAFLDAAGEETDTTSQFRLTQNGVTLTNDLIVPPGETRTVEVQYQPSMVGSAETFLWLENNDLDEFATSSVQLTAQSDGRPIPLPANTPYSFRDGDGDLVFVTITQGSATLYLEGGKYDRADISVLNVSNTLPNARLTIISTGQTTIGSIQVENDDAKPASLASIIAPRVNLENQINISGSLNTLLIGNIIPANAAIGAAVNVNQPSSRPMTILAGQIGENVSFDLSSELQTFRAASFLSGRLQADKVNQVNIANGPLGADVIADGITGGSIGNVSVNGDITGDIRALYGIGSVTSLSGSIDDNFIIAGDSSLLPDFFIDYQPHGGINRVAAQKDISGTILALENIQSITNQGTLSGTVRARNVNLIITHDLDRALLSTSDSIGMLFVRNDVIDSYILPGYDIGMDGLPGEEIPSVSGGNIRFFWFGGNSKDSVYPQ